MVLYAEMTYFVVPPPTLSSDDYVILPKGIIKCNAILSLVETPPFTRVNTKLFDQQQLREFTDEVSKQLLCCIVYVYVCTRNGSL